MAHRVIIFNAIGEHQLGAFAARLPPRSYTAPWWLPTEVCQHSIRLIQDVFLLLEGHIHRIFTASALI